MRILLTTDSYFPVVSGVTTVVRSLGQAFEKQGHTVAVMAPIKFTFDKNNISSSPPVLGIFSLRNPIRPDHYIPFPSYVDMDQKILTFAPDIIHAHSPGPIGAVATRIAQKKHIPMIASCHGVPGYVTSYFPYFPKPIIRIFTSILWKYYRWFFNSQQHIVAPSEFIKFTLRQHGISTPLTEIPMWIDLPRITPKEAKITLRRRWNIPDRAYTFLYFGRLDWDKKLITLLLAFKKLLKENIQGKKPYLLIVGKGRQGALLQRLVNERRIKKVTIEQRHIETEKIEEMYALSDSFVMPGPYEAQSIVTLQAIARNLPVILGNSGALPEIAHRFPDRSYLFNTNSPKDLAGVMKTLMEKRKPSPVDTFIFNKYYDTSHILSMYISLYRSLSRKPLL